MLYQIVLLHIFVFVFCLFLIYAGRFIVYHVIVVVLQFLILNIYACAQVSLTTHILANLLALSSNGPTISPEDNVDDATRDVSQEQDGTGMGEGVGRTDVSDQITNEDQLIGAPEKVLIWALDRYFCFLKY